MEIKEFTKNACYVNQNFTCYYFLVVFCLRNSFAARQYLGAV